MDYEYVYGVQPVLQVLSVQKRKAIRLFIHRSDFSPDLKKILQLAQNQKIPFEEKDKFALSQMVDSPQHQGVALKTEKFSYHPFENLLYELSKEESGVLLALDQIQDPQNLGAILRTAACANVKGVILPEKGSALVTPSVLKVSAGAAESIPISVVTNLARSLDQLKEIPMWIYGAEAESDLCYYKQDYPAKTVLVLGSEGFGLRSLIKKKCDFLISIPLAGNISSLNVSVATGILCFEILRQHS